MYLTKSNKKEIREKLNKNVTFNMFGLCVLNPLRASLSFDIGKLQLKNHIKKTFNNEMVNDIEFK